MTELGAHPSDHANVPVPPWVFFLPLIISVLFHYLVWPLSFSLPAVLGGWVAQIVVGALVGLVGFGLQGLAIAEFQKTGQKPDVTTPTTSIIRSGPYRYSRHPMYLGAVLIHLGVGLGTGSLWVVVALLAAIALAQFLAILPEEQYLERRFGDEYRAYEASVRQWL